MLTGAFCRDGDGDGDAMVASLFVVADEVAVDLSLLLRHQVSLLGLLRFVVARLRHEPEVGRIHTSSPSSTLLPGAKAAASSSLH
jgi:hypothetical protein